MLLRLSAELSPAGSAGGEASSAGGEASAASAARTEIASAEPADEREVAITEARDRDVRAADEREARARLEAEIAISALAADIAELEARRRDPADGPPALVRSERAGGLPAPVPAPLAADLRRHSASMQPAQPGCALTLPPSASHAGALAEVVCSAMVTAAAALEWRCANGARCAGEAPAACGGHELEQEVWPWFTPCLL